MNLQKNRPGHLWKPGQSGNPAGRPVSSRQKISEKLLADLAAVWETHGTSVLERLAITDPGKLAQMLTAYCLAMSSSASSSGPQAILVLTSGRYSVALQPEVSAAA